MYKYGLFYVTAITVLYLCSFATASAVLFHAFNTAVISYQASYDFNIKVERYRRFLFTFRVKVSHYGFALWFRIVVSHRGFALWFRIAIIGIDNYSNSYVNYTQLIYVYVNRVHNLWNLKALCITDT